MSSNYNEVDYAKCNQEFLKKRVFSQPLVHIVAENNKRAFLVAFFRPECFPPKIRDLAEKIALQLREKLRAAHVSFNQSGATYSDSDPKRGDLNFLNQQREKQKTLPLDELGRQQAEWLLALYNYIFDANGNYTDAFNVPGRDLDQFLRVRGLTKQDLFWQYVQHYQNRVYEILYEKAAAVISLDSPYIQPILNTVYSPAIGNDGDESGRKMACAFFDEKFFGAGESKAKEESKEESKEEVKEPSSQFEHPWPNDIRVCRWLNTARAELKDPTAEFKLEANTMYIEQLATGSLRCFYLNETGEEKTVKIPAKAFLTVPPAQKTKAMNQFCERLCRLKQATKDKPFSEEDSAAFLNSMAGFPPLVTVMPTSAKSVTKRKLDFTEQAPACAFEPKASVVGYTKSSDELNVFDSKDEEAKRKQHLAELDETLERKSKEKGLKEKELKEKEEVKLKSEFIRYELLSNPKNLGNQVVPQKNTPSKDIVRINTESPLRIKVKGKDVKKTYHKAASHSTYKIENAIDTDADIKRNISQIISTLLFNLSKIESGEWVEGLYDYRLQGIGYVRERLAEDERLIKAMEGDEAKQAILIQRIDEQKEELKAYTVEMKINSAHISERKEIAAQHWSNSEIGHKRTACQPVLDRLDKAIQENTLNKLDIVILFEFRKKLVELRVAHESLNANLNRAPLVSNINSLNKLIVILEEEITVQLTALKAPKEKIAQILQQSEEKALANVVELYFEETVSSEEERYVRERLKDLYNNKQISTHQFIFACKCFAQDKKLRSSFMHLYTGVTRDFDILLAFIAAVMIHGDFPQKKETLSKQINSPTPEKVNKEQFILACEVLKKEDVYKAVITGVSAKYKNKKDVLCNLLKNKKITEDEFVYMVEQLSDEAVDASIVDTFIAIARAKPVFFKNNFGQERNLRENLYELFKKDKISQEIYYFTLQQLNIKPALSEAVFLIGSIAQKRIIEHSYALLRDKKISEGDFIEIVLPAKTEIMSENEIQKAMDTKKQDVEKYNESISILKNSLDKLKEKFSDFNVEGNFEKFSFLKNIIIQDIDALLNIETSQQKRDILLLKLCRQVMWIDNNYQIEEKDSFFDVAIELLELRASVELKKSAEYQFLMQYKDVKKGIKANSNNMESRLLTELNTTMRQFYTLAQDHHR